jgi:predicted Fe-S protein YdhL (DUF1289 family)
LSVPTRIEGKPVPSPCISVCVIDERTGLCTGCQRTLDEIAAWSVLDDAERRAVWTRIGLRRAALNPAIATPTKD